MLGLLPIGRFARCCRLSVKALRHYDELGLLPAAHVDVASGYRYYRREQAPVAIAIALLRSFDVPLATVRELVAAESPEALRHTLGRERDRLTREVARGHNALRAIERLMVAGEILPYEVTAREDPGAIAIAAESVVAAEDHVEATQALVHRLLAEVDRRQLAPTGPVFCVLPPCDEDRMILRVGVPLAAEPAAVDGMILYLAPGLVAATMHVGSYDEVGLADHALQAWIHERGFEPSGAVREVYLSDPAATPASELVTEVLQPIRRAG